MSEEKSLLDRALDVMVFAPLALAADQGEELARLAAKGRRRVEPQMTMAKVVGRLAFGQFQREMEQQVTETAARMRLLLGGNPAPPAADRGQVIDATDLVESTGTADTKDRGDADAAPPPRATKAAPRRRETGGKKSRAAGAGKGQPTAPASADLPIHGYDALSAPQVMKRLAGLSEEELETVRAYEAATRGRRTILARIAQLQAGSGG
jgi:hypothetical protein